MREQNSQVPRRMIERSTGVVMSGLRSYFFVPFRVLGFFIRIFRANRAWVASRLAHKPAAYSMSGITFITLLAWFVIWLLAV